LLGAAILYSVVTPQSNMDAVSFILYAAAIPCLLIGGYSANDVADYAQDLRVPAAQRVGHPMRQDSARCAWITLAAGLLLVLLASSDWLPFGLAILTVAVGLQYSLPPLRLKERGVFGVLAGAVTQRPALFRLFGISGGNHHLSNQYDMRIIDKTCPE